MKHLPRRLAVLGGALAMAAGGFAFLAENQASPSSLGEGQSTVTGYTVANISPTEVPGPTYVGHTGSTATEYVVGLTFTLTSSLTTTAKPTTIIVAPINYAHKITTGAVNPGRPIENKYGFGTTYNLVTAAAEATAQLKRGCILDTWSTNSGNVTCYFSYPYYGTSDAPLAQTVAYWDITASN